MNNIVYMIVIAFVSSFLTYLIMRNKNKKLERACVETRNRFTEFARYLFNTINTCETLYIQAICLIEELRDKKVNICMPYIDIDVIDTSANNCMKAITDTDNMDIIQENMRVLCDLNVAKIRKMREIKTLIEDSRGSSDSTEE